VVEDPKGCLPDGRARQIFRSLLPPLNDDEMISQLYHSIWVFLSRNTRRSRFDGIIKFEAGSLFIDSRREWMNQIDRIVSTAHLSSAAQPSFPTCHGCGVKQTENFFTSPRDQKILCRKCFDTLQLRTSAVEIGSGKSC